MKSFPQSDFRLLPVWHQARRFALAMIALGCEFPSTVPARRWVWRMERASLAMISAIVAAFDGRGEFHDVRRSIDHIATTLQEARDKKMISRQDLARLTRELDSVRSLLAVQEAALSAHSQLNTHSFIPISTGVSHD